MDDNADVVVRLYEAIPFPCPLKTCGRVQTLNITQPKRVLKVLRGHKNGRRETLSSNYSLDTCGSLTPITICDSQLQN